MTVTAQTAEVMDVAILRMQRSKLVEMAGGPDQPSLNEKIAREIAKRNYIRIPFDRPEMSLVSLVKVPDPHIVLSSDQKAGLRILQTALHVAHAAGKPGEKRRLALRAGTEMLCANDDETYRRIALGHLIYWSENEPGCDHTPPIRELPESLQQAAAFLFDAALAIGNTVSKRSIDRLEAAMKPSGYNRKDIFAYFVRPEYALLG